MSETVTPPVPPYKDGDRVGGMSIWGGEIELCSAAYASGAASRDAEVERLRGALNILGQDLVHQLGGVHTDMARLSDWSRRIHLAREALHPTPGTGTPEHKEETK